MRKHLLDLFELQKVDLGIRDLDNRREAIPSRLGELEQGAAALQQEVEQLENQRDELLREQKTLEGTIQAESHKIRKWEQRLSDIRNQREYLALSREIEGTKRQNRDMEERVLELMAQRDQVDKDYEAKHDSLAEAEVDSGTERDHVQSLLSELENELAEARARRERLLPDVPKQLLKRYEMIRKKRMGIGLVSVVDGSCQGCNMKLPPQLYNILQRGDTVEQCPSCSRIIYWDQLLGGEDDESAASSGAEASV